MRIFPPGRPELLGQCALHLALAISAFFILLPFWIMLRASVTPQEEMFAGEFWTLPQITFEHYSRVLSEIPIFRYYLNGIFVVSAIFFGQLLICVPAAYALARLRFRGRQMGFWLVLAAMLVPYQVTAIPVFALMSMLGLVNSYSALITPFLASAFGTFLLRQFFLSIPASVFEAARLDGASSFTVMTSIVLPMARPAITTFGILSFVTHWNDYFWPSVMLRNDDYATVPFGIIHFLNQDLGVEYGPQMAAATLTVMPLLLGFLLAQKQFIAGIALTSGQGH